jgi:hypothetical protein
MGRQLWRSCVRRRGEQAKKTNKANVGRPGPTTARALRARTKARASGPAGPGRDPTSMEVSAKIFTQPADPVGCVTDRVNFWVSEISTFFTLGLHYRPRAQISNHRRSLLTIVNFREIFVFGIWTPKNKNSHLSSGKKNIRSKKKLGI